MAAKKKTVKPSKTQKKLAKKVAAKPTVKAAAKAVKPSGAKPSGKPMSAKPMSAKAVAAKPGAVKAGAAPARSKRSASWLDEQSHKPTIERHARQLRSFLKAMEDGKIDESELDEQEQRLVALMREIEPQLDDALHARVTELLCELTAYDLMQTLHSINAGRPKPVFRG